MVTQNLVPAIVSLANSIVTALKPKLKNGEVDLTIDRLTVQNLVQGDLTSQPQAPKGKQGPGGN